MPSSLSPWPQSLPVTWLGAHSLEPSGLTFISHDNANWMYMASDNGRIARMEMNGDDAWQSQSYDGSSAHDFESIITIGAKLMVGIEGAADANDAPVLKRFDPALTSHDMPLGDFTGSSWVLGGLDLDKGCGMEALTFIPDAACPPAWGASSHYGGFFVIATQSALGRLYVFNLEKGGKKAHAVDSPVRTITHDLLPYRISDLHYSLESGLLFVLYDDVCDPADNNDDGYHATNYVGALQILKLDNDTGRFETRAAMKTPYVGCEAIAYRGNDLYLGLDQTGLPDPPTEQFAANGLDRNYVLIYRDFLSEIMTEKISR